MAHSQLNIALLPSLDVIHNAVSMSKKLASHFTSEIELNTKDCIPHVTLYQALYPQESIERLRVSVAKSIENIHPFELTLQTFNFSRKPFLFWECIKNESLQHLHESIVQVANPLRNGAIRKDFDLTVLSNEERFDMENFGSLLIGPHFTPHITLSFLPQIETGKKIHEIIGDKSEQTFVANKIIIGASGQHGTIKEIRDEFTLTLER